MTAALTALLSGIAIGFGLGISAGFKLWRQNYDRVQLISNTRRGWLR